MEGDFLARISRKDLRHARLRNGLPLPSHRTGALLLPGRALNYHVERKNRDGEFAQSACLPSGMSVCLMANVLQQQTISRPATYSAIGLHTGGRVNMSFLPAPPGARIRFPRVAR